MRRQPVSGFTLLELLVVVAILSVAAALVLPAALGGSETIRLRKEAGRVAALLRQARHHAVAQRRPVSVTLDRARYRVTLEHGDARRGVSEVVLDPAHRLQVVAGGDRVTFSSRGLARETEWSLETGAGRALIIRVEGVTGRVSVAAPERRT